jgi:hypothetical protein
MRKTTRRSKRSGKEQIPWVGTGQAQAIHRCEIRFDQLVRGSNVVRSGRLNAFDAATFAPERGIIDIDAVATW